MGFWRNNNGQGIITGGAYTLVGTVKVCNSGTWLRQFPPFQDLSTTATCAQVASYVTNVINAATCSTNGTCNTMLKSQMLATALDVYFSDPLLGGNKIGAFNGNGNNQVALGGVGIDLTSICAKSDGGFSGTCGENVTASFGNTPTCQSIFTMLSYSKQTQGTNYPWGTMYVSNVGGGNWYNNKVTYQVPAKDAFDAINNASANVCTP